MTRKLSVQSTDFEMKVDGTMHYATYVVEDDCVQVTYRGRKSTWTQVGGGTPGMVARMLLHEVIEPDTDIDRVAMAINEAVYGSNASTRWHESSEVRDQRRKEARAAIAAMGHRSQAA